MFRSVPRQKLDERLDNFNNDSKGPISTKYTPSYTQVHKPITKNFDFGDAS